MSTTVGLNAKRLPWSCDGTPAHELNAAHFDRLADDVQTLVRGRRERSRSVA